MKKSKKVLFKVLLLLSKSRIKFHVVLENRAEPIPGIPVIYSCNHTNKYDVPIAIKSVGHLCKVLVGKQKLYLSDTMFFLLNGCFWVDRKDKNDSRRVVVKITNWFIKGKDMLWFPEGTWNMTDSLPMLPMKWGIVEVAQKSNAQIIPMAIEYDREKMIAYVSFGKPRLYREENNKSEGIKVLRDKMASVRWMMWEKNPVISRTKVNVNAEREKIMYAVKEYPPLDYEYEKSVIFNNQRK